MWLHISPCLNPPRWPPPSPPSPCRHTTVLSNHLAISCRPQICSSLQRLHYLFLHTCCFDPPPPSSFRQSIAPFLPSLLPPSLRPTGNHHLSCSPSAPSRHPSSSFSSETPLARPKLLGDITRPSLRCHSPSAMLSQTLAAEHSVFSYLAHLHHLFTFEISLALTNTFPRRFPIT